MTTELRFEQSIQAEPDEVYRMFTNSTAMREWLADRVLANPIPNGCLYLEWQTGENAHGWFTELEPARRVAFKIHGRGEPGPSQVEIWIERHDGGSLLTLTHNEFGEGSEWEVARNNLCSVWENALQRLVNSLESGEDLRITTRPMLGVLFGVYNPETARKLNVPVDKGLLLSDAVEGMGAYKAGLQKNDVIVMMNGQDVANFADVQAVIRGKKAGDTVQVTYYRGVEKCEASMVLSRRVLPEIPTTISGLADALKQLYHHEQAELVSVLKGVTEEEASYKPSEDEWSVKEVLAHLIQGERGVQNFIYELYYGVESVADGYGDNLTAYIKATTEVYGTAKALEDVFHASREETIRLLANLPESFAKRKSTFWKLGYQLLSYPLHTHEHAGQMLAAIEKARTHR